MHNIYIFMKFNWILKKKKEKRKTEILT